MSPLRRCQVEIFIGQVEIGMSLAISKTFHFEASHILPLHPGTCSRLHGHSWQLTVTVEGEPDPQTGMIADFYDISRWVNTEVVANLDHTHLGAGPAATNLGINVFDYKVWRPFLGPDFYPTSENLVIAIMTLLQTTIKEYLPHEARLASITLNETCTSAATWRAS